jgi:hypothetical protein
MAQESIGVDICLAGGQASCSGVNLAFAALRGAGFSFFRKSGVTRSHQNSGSPQQQVSKSEAAGLKNGSSLDGGSSERRLVETAARRNSGFEQQPLRTAAPQNSSPSEQQPLRTEAFRTEAFKTA